MIKSIYRLEEERSTFNERLMKDLQARRKYLKLEIANLSKKHEAENKRALKRFINRAVKSAGDPDPDTDFIVLEKISFFYPRYANDEAFYRYGKKSQLPQQAARVLIRNDFQVEDSHRDNEVPNFYNGHHPKYPHPLAGKPFPDELMITVYEAALGEEFKPVKAPEVAELEQELEDSQVLLRKMRGRGGNSGVSQAAKDAGRMVQNYQKPREGRSYKARL